MLGLMELLRLAKEKNASDIFIVSGQPLSYKSEGAIVTVDDEKVMPPTAEALIKEAYAIGHRDMSHFENTGDDDFAPGDTDAWGNFNPRPPCGGRHQFARIAFFRL